MKKRFVALLALAILSVQSAEITGAKVIKVYDGDTIRIEDRDGGKFKIRFADIDAPESTQEYGHEAKEAMRKMVEWRRVDVKFLTIDVYGRIVGTVTVKQGDKTVNVNRWMLENGHAWFYGAYSKNAEYRKLEEVARMTKTGLWKSENPKNPAIYRKEQKAKKGAEK